MLPSRLLSAAFATWVAVVLTLSASAQAISLVQPSDSQADDLRLATWNIRWFPHGCPDPTECPERATDLDALAYAITGGGFDLVAVQEILKDSTSEVALAVLVQKLDSLTGGTWRVDLQDCGPPGSQHVGFLWNDHRVSMSNFRDVEALNGASEDGGGACAGDLRPGRYAYAKSRTGGVDFHALTVHFDSGRRDKDYQNRRDAARQIQLLEIDGTSLWELDEDVVLFGDLNTMGRALPEITAQAELETLDAEISPRLRRLAIEPPCTEYYRGRGGMLDHFLVSREMDEAGKTTRTEGYCASARCADLDEAQMPDAYLRLSDHCPVVLRVRDEDID